MSTEVTVEGLDRRFKDMLVQFDRGAVQRKRRYQALWMSITFLTFFNMILAALSEHFAHEPWFHNPEESLSYKTLANIAFTGIGLTIIALTVVQTTAGLQGRWLAYRGAAERLRRICMLFRARLPPFDGPDPHRVMKEMLDEIERVAQKKDTDELRTRFSWRHAWTLWNMTDEQAVSSPSTPDRGLVDGPLRHSDEVLDGRLHNQRRWYVRKARRYFRDYLLMQGGIVACSAFNAIHVFILGERQFWMIVVSSIISLGLIAVRDFLDWGPLFVRYLQTADSLKAIEDKYNEKKTPFDQPDDQARLKKLAEQVEMTLASEFQYWIYTRR
jgi:hypothetical protein